MSPPHGCPITEAKELICDMCRNFYTQGWCSGSGGGVSIKVALPGGEERIVMAPSGVQKERMLPSDMFVLDAAGEVLETPTARPPPYKPPKLSECSPLFMSAYEMRGAGAVLHSHSLPAVMATMLDPDASEFRITQVEMIKGIEGHGFYDTMVVPIIENTARECELTDRLRAAIKAYPQANAVLVRRHGVYVWGKTWMQAKTQAECYDYLFDAAVRMRQMGLDPTTGPARAESSGAPASKKRKLCKDGGSLDGTTHLVLDIEGTTTPISFVADVMFPYAKRALRSHLEGTWGSAETTADVEALRKQAATDHEGYSVAPATSSKEEQIDSTVKYVEHLMAHDRKVGPLKQLQGHIWRAGFRSGDLVGDLYEDVPRVLEDMHAQGIKAYIYSSGSRESQRMLFGHTKQGNIRHLLNGYFDTTSGSKVQSSSYDNIQHSLGVCNPSQILFATDMYPEAKAAKEAGWTPVLVVRPGNKALPAEAESMRKIHSLEELL